MEQVNSQWQAQAQLYPPAGYQRGMLNITLDDGSLLPPAPISFSATRNYQTPPEPAHILLDSFSYDEEANLYLFDVLLTQYDQIKGFQLSVIDNESNVQATQSIHQGPAWVSQQLQLSGNSLKPNRMYTLEVTPLDTNLLPVRDESGNILQASYEFRHEPVRPLLITINSVRVTDDEGKINLRDLRIEDEPPEIQLALIIENGDQAANYEGYFFDPSIDQQIGDKFTLTTLLGDGTGAYAVNLPLPITENGRYAVFVNEVNEDGAVLASDSQGFAYTVPTGPVLRSWYALRDNRLLIVTGILLLFLIGLVAWALGTAVGKRRAAKKLKKETAVDTPPPAPKKEGFPVINLKVIESPDSNLTQNGHLTITQSPYTIGREGCDLSIPQDKHISRRHAQITYEGDTFFIEDFASSNGTFINDTQIPARQRTPLDIEHGVKIQIGKRTILSMSNE